MFMFSGPLLLVIVTIWFFPSGATAAPVWRNLGHEECFNGLKKETCGYSQFCSTDKVKMGCRNCTDDDLHLSWCETDPDEFRRRYPSCAIFCERERWKRRESDLNGLVNKKEAKIKELEHKISINEKDLDKKDEDIGVLTKTLIVLGAVVIFGIPAIVILLIFWRKEKRQGKVQRQQIGSASPKKTSFCICFPRKTSLPAQADQEEADISTETKNPLLNGDSENRLQPTAPQQATDENNAAYSGSSDNVNDSGS